MTKRWEQRNAKALEIPGTISEVAQKIDELTANPPSRDGINWSTAAGEKRQIEIEKHHDLVCLHQRRIALDFASSNGLIYSEKRFYPATLAQRAIRASKSASSVDWVNRFADHRFFFRDEEGRAAVVAAHSYDAGKNPSLRSEIEAWAHDMGLRVSYPDYISWYSPARTTLLLFQAAAA
ncbi:hypothetical protein [Nitrospirillum amazonense]|uniref:hypothetical protein n=1 Tax=Nitrospirillum amazonense TaxID=28077 RepID=UPI00119C95DA|nr:hypothetical protein [Nitrospirillum amazonense]